MLLYLILQFLSFLSISTASQCKPLQCGCMQGKSPPWCIPKNYEVQKPPFLYKPVGQQKMNLVFGFTIREVSEVKDSDQVLTIPMYLSIVWMENRLVIDPNHRSWSDNSTGPSNETTEEAETLKNLWRPNLEIYGLEAFTNHKILGDMAGLRITKGKVVKYDLKVTVEISCQMDFTQYPFDEHVCAFQMGSYFYDINSMTCSSTYFDPAAETDFLARNLQHTIKFRRLSKRRRIVRITSGNYAACGFEMVLKRKHEPLMYQVYIPCILFVTVSWISFIIDPKVVPGRMSLLVILFLVIINVFNNVKSSAPSASSSTLNAIEKFVVTCIFSIFSTIIEYAVVLSILTLRPQSQNGSDRLYNVFHNANGLVEKPSIKDRLSFFLENPRILDVCSLVCFSLGFVIFNIHYWYFANYSTKNVH